MESAYSKKAIAIIIIVYIITSVWLIMPIAVLYSESRINPNTGALEGIEIGKIMAMYKNPMLSIAHFKNPKHLTVWVIATFMVGTVIVALYFIALQGRGSIEGQGIGYLKDTGTAGTAKWMERGEIRKVFGVGEPKGIILGKIPGMGVISLPYDTVYNQHITIIGAPGSMKTRSFVRPNIQQLAMDGKSMIITDPKGELYRANHEFLKNLGYDVKIFNLVNMEHSDRWNPAGEVDDDIAAQTFAEVTIANTAVAGRKLGGDPFWDRTEQNLLKALVLYVTTQMPEEARNMKSVYELLVNAGPSGKLLDNLFNVLPSSHPAKGPYNIYMQADDRVKQGVITGLGVRLQIFGNRLVQKLTETSDIDLEKPGRERCAYFVVLSDTDSTFDFLASLFFSFLFIRLVRYADRNGGRCNPDVYFLLDEFSNIGQIPDFTKKLATIRSRGLHCSIVVQSIAQLQNRYPNSGWQEIIGNCDTKLFLGCNDIATAEFISELLGISTVEARTIVKERGPAGWFDWGKENISGQKRYLLNPDEIMKLDINESIIILRGQKPLKVKKMQYTEHKAAKMLPPPSEYYPEWIEHKEEDEQKENKAYDNRERETEENISIAGNTPEALTLSSNEETGEEKDEIEEKSEKPKKTPDKAKVKQKAKPPEYPTDEFWD